MLTKGKKDVIVVPYDFTAQSATALTHANKIAFQNQDEIRLLHILNQSTPSKLKKIHQENSTAAEVLEKIAEGNTEVNKVKTSFHVEEGNIFTNIGAYIKSSNASLAVMGTHGVHGMQHIVGANSLKVVSSSPAPVVIVQKRKIDNEGYKRIVLPIDGDKYGKNKIAYAAAIAKYFDGTVYLFEAKSTDEYVSHRISTNSGMAKDYLEHNRVKYETSRENGGGPYTRQLVRYAGEVDADLIVISSHHDQEGVMDFFFGNSEVQIINNDPQIAVMCVNPVEPVDHLDIASFNW